MSKDLSIFNLSSFTLSVVPKNSTCKIKQIKLNIDNRLDINCVEAGIS